MKQICTTIEQSQKLIELGLSPETADMYYQKVIPKSNKTEHNPKAGNPVEALMWYNKGYATFNKAPLKLEEHCIPAWSLSALLELVPKEINMGTATNYHFSLWPTYDNTWIAIYETAGHYVMEMYEKQTALEAVYEMVVWLIENKCLNKEDDE